MVVSSLKVETWTSETYKHRNSPGKVLEPLSLVHIPRFWSEFCQAPEAELLALRRDSMDVVDAVDERWGVGWCMGRAPFSNSRQFPSSNANGDEDIW